LHEHICANTHEHNTHNTEQHVFDLYIFTHLHESINGEDDAHNTEQCVFARYFCTLTRTQVI